jgi:hypothetical protein
MCFFFERSVVGYRPGGMLSIALISGDPLNRDNVQNRCLCAGPTAQREVAI